MRPTELTLYSSGLLFWIHLCVTAGIYHVHLIPISFINHNNYFKIRNRKISQNKISIKILMASFSSLLLRFLFLILSLPNKVIKPLRRSGLSKVKAAEIMLLGAEDYKISELNETEHGDWILFEFLKAEMTGQDQYHSRFPFLYSLKSVDI